jgi:hypothetical protein
VMMIKPGPRVCAHSPCQASPAAPPPRR